MFDTQDVNYKKRKKWYDKRHLINYFFLLGLFSVIFVAHAEVSSSRPIIPSTARKNKISVLYGIKARRLPGHRAQLQFQFNGPIKKPNSFITTDPATIVLDFMGVTNAMPKPYKRLSIDPITGYQSTAIGNRTRIVVHLSRQVTRHLRANGNKVYLTVTDGSSSGSVIQKVPHPIVNKTKYHITDINFRRRSGGAGELIINLSNPNVKIDIKQQAGYALLNFMNTRIAKKWQRRLNVSDFGTAVHDINIVSDGKNVEMSVSIPKKYHLFNYQVDNKFILNVRTMSKTKQLGTSVKKSGAFTGKRLSMNFQNISVRSALQLLADFAGVNIVISDGVTGNVALHLKNIPWDQALDVILKTRGLGKRKVGDVLLIAPTQEITKQEQQQLLAQQALSSLEPLRSELIKINYGKAATIASLLKKQGTSLLSDRGHVSVDERTNHLWVQDTPQRLAQIHHLIKRLDMPVRQVLIEARIVNIDKTFEHELGIRWGITRSNNISGRLAGANKMRKGVPAADIPIADRLNIDLPATALGSALGPASFGFALAKLGNHMLLDLELSALESQGDVKIIASPRLMTANQKEAVIEAGQGIPYQEATPLGATAIAFKKAVLSLKVTPQITPNDHIILNLKVSQDKRSAETVLNVPAIDTRELQTQVLVNNGQTIVLGGIFQKSRSNQVERVPFLGSLPFLGALFKHTKWEDRQTELLIFITPTIIGQP